MTISKIFLRKILSFIKNVPSRHNCPWQLTLRVLSLGNLIPNDSVNYDDSRDTKVFVRFPANSILKFLLKFWNYVCDTHILPTWKIYRLILQANLKMTFRSKVVAELLGQINFNFFAPIFHMQSVLEIFGGKWIYQ